MTTIVEPLPPGLTAAEAFRRLSTWPHLTFFDSARPDPKLGGYSFLTADPFEFICGHRGKVEVASQSLLPGSAAVASDARPLTPDPLGVVALRLARYQQDPLPGLPPFQGGAAGLLAYDLCHYFERLPRPRFDEFEVPDLAIGLYDWVLAFDHAENQSWIISTGFPETQLRARRRHRAEQRLKQVLATLNQPQQDSLPIGPPADASQTAPLPAPMPLCPSAPLPLGCLAPSYALPGLPDLSSNFSREAYLDAVRRAIEYIYAGDIFQVNLSQRLLYPVGISPVELYLRLRERNPAPFAGYVDLGGLVIASASPERFLHVQNGHVQTRPIKGTRHRGLTPEADLFTRDALLESEKDRAENVMIVDLLRNDLSRVCRPGSVRVPQLCQVEMFEYVQHLVSEVHGQLREGLGPIDLLRAAFPGGSVTGAPKVRAMEIIAELEPTARGAYCGSLAYLGFDGSMDTSILIRTFTIGKGWLQFPVGGGIVAQSVPEHEYEETLDKAEGMIRALV